MSESSVGGVTPKTKGSPPFQNALPLEESPPTSPPRAGPELSPVLIPAAVGTRPRWLTVLVLKLGLLPPENWEGGTAQAG